MKHRVRTLMSSQLVGNVLAVASGTTLAQVVVLVFSPLITRIYGPEAFGVQGVFLSLISILWPLVALRFPMAIVIAKSDDEVQLLTQLSIATSVVMSSVLLFAIFIFYDDIISVFSIESLGGSIFILPVALIFVTIQDVMDYRAARLGAFQVIAVVTVVQAFLTNLSRVLGGIIAPVSVTLVIVTSIAPGIQAFLLAWKNCGRFGPFPAVDFHRLRALASAHRDFPVYRAPTDMLNAASQSIPVIILAALFSPAAAGAYVLARSVLNLPANILGSAIGNVLYARFAEMARDNKPVAPLATKATLFLLLPSPVILLGAQFAPEVFGFVFGEEWTVSGIYARWMAIWIVLLIANVASVRILPVIGKQDLHLVFNIIVFAGGVFGLFIGSMMFRTELGAVAGYSVALMIIYVLQIWVYLYFARKFDQRLVL